MDEQAQDAALDAALSGISEPAADPDFRARLRERFVAGAFEDDPDLSKHAVTSETVMSQSDDVMDLEPALQAIQPPAARPEFKQELREQFLGAASGEQVVAHRPSPRPSPKPSSKPIRRSRPGRARRKAGSKGSQAPRGARRQRRLTWSIGGGAVAIAAALLAVFFLRTPAAVSAPSAGWQLLPIASVPAPSAFQVDGVAFVPGQDLAKANVITAGTEVLRLQFYDQLVVDLEPGSSLDIRGTRGDGDIVLAMAGRRGGYRVATLGGFDSTQRRLLFRTPDAEVEVRGTVFGIDRYEVSKSAAGGTCVCCCRGTVLVRAFESGDQASVLEGKSSFVVAGIGAISPMPMPASHAHPLDEMAAQLY